MAHRTVQARVALAMILVVFGIAMLTAFQLRVGRSMRDFEVYWQAGGRAVAGAPLYREEDGHYQFKYLPAFAFVVSPLSQLPLSTAKAAWFTLSVVLLAWLVRLSVRLVPHPRTARWLIGLLTVVTLAKFYGHELVLGQNNTIVAVLALLAATSLRADREKRAGLLYAGSVIAKPHAVVFLIYLAALQRFRALGWAILGLLASLLLPAVRYGLSGSLALLSGWSWTIWSSTGPILTTQDNVSIFALFGKWMGVGRPAFLLSTAVGLGLVGLVAAVLRARRDVAFPEYLEAAMLLTLIPLASPQGWDYVLLMATPAVACLVGHFASLAPLFRFVTVFAMVGLGLTLYDVLGPSAYVQFMAWSGITVCGLLLLASLWHLRSARTA